MRFASLGSGTQWMPWIHIDDLVAMMAWVIEGEREGHWNGVAPHPVRNGELMAALRSSFGRPWVPSAPSGLLSLMQPITRVEPYLVLTSQRISSAKATERGFTFKFPELEEALATLR